MSRNKEVAAILYRMADVLELEEVEFKPMAYRNAAMAIENLTENIEDIAKQDRLEEIAGIGKGIAAKIKEFLATGGIKELEKEEKKMPVKAEELMQVGGVGPKTIRALYKKLKITNLKELESAAKKHEIQALAGFGETTETNILRSVEFAKKAGKRMLLSEALPEAEAVAEQLKNSGLMKNVTIAGSIRRRKETIGDVDILAASANPKYAVEFFTTKINGIIRVLAKGPTKASIMLKNRLHVDLRILAEKSFGAGLQYFTGSKEHGIHTRKIAISIGCKLSEYGLFRGAKQIAGENEGGIYKKLRMQYIEPELREDKGEIEAALTHSLPKLVALRDIKGDFHAHTKASDGEYNIREMAEAALRQGLKYITITDHTRGLKIAGGLTGRELLKQKDWIKELNKKIRGIKIFSGAEVNIQKDGTPDIRDGVLKKLDVVIGSIHSGFKESREKITKRICTAMENPYIHIIGHPTGRLLQRREAYNLDFNKVCKTAAKTGTCLEINAHPSRIDLGAELIKIAAENHVKLSIGTDSHSINHFKFMEFGVYAARRGWCTAKELANTREASQALKWLEKR